MKPKTATHHLSPLRYPGGKAKLAGELKGIIRKNALLDRIYVEPFAGGAGVGLALLMHGFVKKIIINDLNPPIYAFWRAVVDDPDRFCEAIHSAELSLDGWNEQRAIFRNEKRTTFELGFATFFLNRTNHSGILNGGVIGGKSQASNYKIDARFNRNELISRIKRIKRYKDDIEVINEDAGNLLESTDRFANPNDIFIYADPPYVHKGPDLYYDFFKKDDHIRLAEIVKKMDKDISWAVSYDNDPLVKLLYHDCRSAEYSLNYSVKNGREGTEIIFFSENILDFSDFLEIRT